MNDDKDQSDDGDLADVRQLLPLHDLPRDERGRLGVTRGRGRPRRIEPAPSRDAYLEELDELRVEHAARDPLVALEPVPGDRLRALDESIRAMAVEAAALGFDRRQAEQRGADIGQLASRRCDALARIAALVVERSRYSEGELPPALLAKLIDFFMATVSETAGACLPLEKAETFLGALRALVEASEPYRTAHGL
jgi:hypothetical protein